jgi:hypothetical protein
MSGIVLIVALEGFCWEGGLAWVLVERANAHVSALRSSAHVSILCEVKSISVVRVSSVTSFESLVVLRRAPFLLHAWRHRLPSSGEKPA